MQPVSQSTFVGQSATFTVSATGTNPLSYQWQKNATAISGATTATYTTQPVTSGDNGALFNVVVSNSAGQITSSSATLTVTTTTAGVDVVTYHNDNTRAPARISSKLASH
jgi:hypothetical protein